SPLNGAKYSLGSNSVYNLTANVIDAESPDSQLSYQWQVILHHNNHEHISPPDTNHITTATLTPAGCHGKLYYYLVSLTVTDPAGLSTVKEVRLLPDCPGTVTPTITWPATTAITYGTALGPAQLNATTGVPGAFTYTPPAGTVFNAG